MSSVRETGSDPDELMARWPALQALLEQGRAVDAAAAIGGVEGARRLARTTRTPEARIRLARIVGSTGSPRAAALLIRHAAREWPDHPEVRAEWLLQLSMTSPVEGLFYIDAHGEQVPDRLSVDIAASWLHGRSLVATGLRLFEDAHRIAAEARCRIPDHPWSTLIGANALLCEDRRAEALSVIDATLERFPHSGYAHRLRVHVLSLVGRAEDAIAHADRALGLAQVASIAEQAAALLVERGDRAAALGFLDRAVAFSPLADRSIRTRLLNLRLESLFLESRYDEAREAAETLVAAQRRNLGRDGRKTYAERILEAMRSDDFASRRRVVLPVPFVAQDHVTCSPASLAAIAGRWREGDSVEDLHRLIADEICADGTPRELSRAWADRNGWATAEFVPDPASARELIARGIPFAIHTAWLGGAHSQTLMGFDERTERAVVREPSSPRFIEYRLDLSPRVLPAQRISGLVMVPAGSPEAEALRVIELPKREQMDIAHRVRLAWREGDEPAAERAFDELRTRFPGDDVTLLVACDRAHRRSNDFDALDALETLYQRYPDDDLLVRHYTAALGRVGRASEMEGIWARALARSDAAPGLRVDRVARLLRTDTDAGTIEDAILEALRAGHPASECLVLLASLREREGRLHDAERLLRINSFVAPSHRSSMDYWLEVAQRNGRLSEVIGELEARIASGRAAEQLLFRTLVGAMWMRGLRGEACARVEREAERRPDDLSLALMRVRYHRAVGRLDEAARELDALRDRVSEVDRLHESALIAAARHDIPSRKRHLRALLELDPTSMFAWHGLHEIAAHPRALDDLADELRRYFDRMPGNWEVARLLARLCSERDPGEAIRLIERHLAENPRSADALMTLSRLSSSVGDTTKSVDSARRACALAPHSDHAWTILACALLAAGLPDEAQDAAARSFAIEPAGYTIDLMMQALPDTRARSEWLRGQWRAALEHPRSPKRIEALMLSSAPPLPFDEVARLAMRCDPTPEHEEIHAELVRLALRTREFEQAVETSAFLLEHYAHSETAHALRVDALSAAGHQAKAIAAAERWGAEIPHSAQSGWALVHIHFEAQDDAAALAPLERIVALRPNDVHAVVTLAGVLLRLKRAEEGLARLDELWSDAPSTEIGWHRVDFAVEAGDRTAVRTRIQELVPHLHDPDEALVNLNSRAKAAHWVRRIWREALEAVDDASPPGARAAWVFVTIGRHTVVETIRGMERRFTTTDAVDDALQALVFVATYRRYYRITDLLLARFPDALKRRPSSFIAFADALWVARRRRDARAWLRSWKDRDDLVAGSLRLVARILDALGDHDGAIAAARRGLPLARAEGYTGFLSIHAVALAGKRDARSLEEARALFQRVLESPATRESVGIARWALHAYALLENPGKPSDMAMGKLAEEARALRAAEECPIVESLLEAFGALFLERGCSRSECGFAPAWWRTLREDAKELRTRMKMRLHHAAFSLACPLYRLVGSERTRFDGIQ